MNRLNVFSTLCLNIFQGTWIAKRLRGAGFDRLRKFDIICMGWRLRLRPLEDDVHAFMKRESTLYCI